MKMPGVAVSCLMTVIGCQSDDAVPAQAASAENELRGVWSLAAIDPGDGSPTVAPGQAGLYIFSEGYYSAAYSPGAERRVKSQIPFQATEEEILAQYSTIIVNAGTYETQGSTVTFRPMIAKEPGFVGGHQRSTFQVSGDTLRLITQSITAADGVSSTNASETLVLERLE